MENCNRCRFCNRKLEGLTKCGCVQSFENEKLWDSTLRRRDRQRKEKL
jgi:hypothetical protein